MTNLVALAEGTELVSDYRVRRVLGAGGFGITYLAEETPLERLVTIKEYFPVDFAARDQADDVCPRSRDSEGDYKWGLERFIAEAQTLAKFTHPNIVRVYRYFRARNTGYIVLHFEEGPSFKGWLQGLGRAPRQQELDRILVPLLEALEVIHTADFLHRDIAPDNIIIRKDGQPVLIDFGSARGDIAKHTKTLSALVKPGYSPYEQYATTATRQGPWTDIYSLAATLYHAVTGKRPADAPSRMVADELVPVRDAALSSYRPGFLAAIDRAMTLDMAKRPQSVADWRAELMAPSKKAQGWGKSWTAGHKAKDNATKEPAVDFAIPAGAASPELAVSTPGPSALHPSALHPSALHSPVRSAASTSASVGAAKATASRGVIGSFLDGWRRAGPVSVPAMAIAMSMEPRAANATPVLTPAAKPEPRSEPRSEPRPELKPELKPQPKPAEARRIPPPRALRLRARWPWKSVAAKLLIGLGIAAAAVALQDRLPPSNDDRATPLISHPAIGGPLGQLKGHRGPVHAIGFTSDGRSIVSASADGTIKVWDAATRTLIRTFELDSGAALAMAVDGRRAVTGHKDGTVAIWDLETGGKLAGFRRNASSIRSVTFVGDAGRVAAAAEDWAVAIWDAKSPATPANLLEGHESAAQAVAYSAQARHIASGSTDKTVKLWKADSGTIVRSYRGHADVVSALAFAPDGQKLASAAMDGEIRIWSTRSSRLHYTLRGHRGRVASLAFAPDGETLASASDDGSVRLWTVKFGRSLRTMQSYTGELRAVSFAPDGRHVATAGNDGLVRLYSAVVSKSGY